MNDRLVILATNVLLAENRDYVYDPEHKKRPSGGNWRQTEEGWSNTEVKNKQTVAPAAPSQKQPTVQDKKPVTYHIPDGELKNHKTLSKVELKTILNEGQYSVLSAGRNFRDETETKLKPDDPSFHERHLQLRDDLERSGMKYTEVVGHYDGLEPSFLVLHEHKGGLTPKTSGKFMVHHKGPKDFATVKKVEDLGKKYNQDSVLHSYNGRNTMVFTTGAQKGKRCGGHGYTENPEATNYYTDIPLKEGNNSKITLDIQECFKRKLLSMRLLKIAKEMFNMPVMFEVRLDGSGWMNKKFIMNPHVMQDKHQREKVVTKFFKEQGYTQVETRHWKQV